MGYTKTAIKGFSWLTAFRVVTRGVSLLKTVVVARFLSPAQFGVFGIAMLVLGFVEVVTETGVNVFLVQEKDDVDKYINTAWLVSIIRGILIALVMVISAPLVAHFFNTPESANLIYAMSLVPFLRGFINPSVVKFQKELEFKKEFYFRSTILVFEILATVIFLFLDPAPISLIWGLVVGVLVEVILSFMLISPLPKIEINKAYFFKIAHQGKWVTGVVIFNYGFERGDDIVVGRVLDTSALGVYDMAYRFSMLPITEVSNIVTRVIFPVFVKISDDYNRLKRAYLRSIVTVTVLVLPFGLFVFLFPTEIIRIVLGEKWLEAAEVLRVLAFLGVIRAVSHAISTLLYALKKQKHLTLTTLIGLSGMLVTIVPLISLYGIVGAAYAATFGYLFSVPFVIYFSWKALRATQK